MILGFGILIGALFNKPPLKTEIKEASPRVELTTPSSTANVAQFSVSENQSETALVKVVRVIDGDTIELESGEKVRYIGIDTPETVDPRKPVECYGVFASAKNKELVLNKFVRLEKDITDKDKYKRLLRYVWLGDELVNRSLVAQGFAHSYSYPPDIKYQEQFVSAERQAREKKLGLWNQCVANNGATILKSEALISNPTCVIKGNISLSGEKIYHLPGCGSYAKTQIDERHGEHWFCSELEAKSAGFRKALNCM